ncbi:AfsR/SARP family transcriptional regulator, partial [Kutzneria sp. 744]|uniref:AfsR/SARP family transcriptional regulator n=1 Tax=Kutzneria sp. (strain 744) TaxID=345341 RepID=UPI0003EEC4FE
MTALRRREQLGDVTVHFLILGPLEVRASGKLITVEGLRQRRLLAILLININRTIGVERLADELWIEPPQSFRQQIHNAIGSLRRTLIPAIDRLRITTTDGGYRLELPESHVDAHEFHNLIRLAQQAKDSGQPEEAAKNLESALSLWRGTLLLGLDSRMISSMATSFDEDRLIAFESLVELRIQLGQSGSVIGGLREMLTENQFRESLRGSLMRALDSAGRQADALAVYEDGRKLLANELGLDPGPEIRRLHTEIL